MMANLIDFLDAELQRDYNLPLSDVCKQEYNPDLTEQLQDIYPSLPNAGFKNFDLLATKEELAALKSLKVESINEYGYESAGHQYTAKHYEYTNYGSMDTLTGEVEDYLNLLSSENQMISGVVAKFVNKLVGSVMSSQNSESAFLFFRAYSPNNEPYLPRWHTDSCRFEGSVPILVTFKGASTLFYNASVEQREKFIDLQSQYLDDLDNIKLNVELSNIFTPYEGNFVATPSGSAFSCGDEQTGVLHTHPPVYEERIFLAIVPGGKSDIDLLYEEFEL
jgi:hypothetical protein